MQSRLMKQFDQVQTFVIAFTKSTHKKTAYSRAFVLGRLLELQVTTLKREFERNLDIDRLQILAASLNQYAALAPTFEEMAMSAKIKYVDLVMLLVKDVETMKAFAAAAGA